MLRGREICILGAGIGGLAAALALARRGARVTVLEQAPALTEIGAGIQVSPNGTAVLDALGVGHTARGAAIEARAVVLRHGPSGRQVARMDFAVHPPSGPFLLLHRADLIGLLETAARGAGVVIRFGHRIDSVEETEGAVRLSGPGWREAVPLAIAADGLHSPARAHLNSPAAPAFTGQVAWRAVVRAEGRTPPVSTVEMGPRRHLVRYPLRGGTALNLVGVEERSGWQAEGWSHRDAPENFRAAFAGFSPGLRRLLDRVERVNIWGLFRHPVAPRWHAERLALLGDAAHPTLPFLAQGANMALEDAWVLAAELDRAAAPEAFAAYQARRIPRVARAIAAAEANARNYHHANPLKLAIGHTGLRLVSRAAPGLLLSRFDWLYRHDVTAGP